MSKREEHKSPSVKAYRPSKNGIQGRTYVATFLNAKGQRTTRSLKTKDDEEAECIADGLSKLMERKPANPADIPLTTHPFALMLYFDVKSMQGLSSRLRGESVVVTTSELMSLGQEPIPAKSALATAAYIKKLELQRLTLMGELSRSQGEQNKLRLEHYKISKALDKTEKEKESVSKSILAYAATLPQCLGPPLDVAVEAFLEDCDRTLQNKKSADSVKSRIKPFLESLPASKRKEPAGKLTPGDVVAFLRALEGSNEKHWTRYTRWRTVLGKFFNWAAIQYGIPSILSAIPKAPMGSVEKERGDIVWYTVEQIEAAIAPLDPYWQALIATLGYSGLRLSELVFMRPKDVDLDKNYLCIKSVPPENGLWGHLIKSHHSVRDVYVHRQLLRPRLEAYIEAGWVGEQAFFAIPRAPKCGRKKSAMGDRWLPDSLGKCLADRLPDGMNALTLRHSFASLLLRSGKSMTETAAAIGDTEVTCRRHYARLEGREIRVDF